MASDYDAVNCQPSFFQVSTSIGSLPKGFGIESTIRGHGLFPGRINGGDYDAAQSQPPFFRFLSGFCQNRFTAEGDWDLLDYSRSRAFARPY